MKNTKKLSAMALTGLMGFSLLGAPVMAATENGKADSKVFYTTNSNTVDTDGKIVMVIPTDMNLNKNKLEATTKFMLKTSSGENFNKYKGFAANIKVTSENGGKLVNNGKTIKAPYVLKNEEKNEDNNWTTPKEDFIAFVEADGNNKNEVFKTLKAVVDSSSSGQMEAAQSGTNFTDTLTYKVTKLSGEGLTYR